MLKLSSSQLQSHLTAYTVRLDEQVARKTFKREMQDAHLRAAVCSEEARLGQLCSYQYFISQWQSYYGSVWRCSQGSYSIHRTRQLVVESVKKWRVPDSTEDQRILYITKCSCEANEDQSFPDTSSGHTSVEGNCGNFPLTYNSSEDLLRSVEAGWS